MSLLPPRKETISPISPLICMGSLQNFEEMIFTPLCVLSGLIYLHGDTTVGKRGYLSLNRYNLHFLISLIANTVENCINQSLYIDFYSVWHGAKFQSHRVFSSVSTPLVNSTHSDPYSDTCCLTAGYDGVLLT